MEPLTLIDGGPTVIDVVLTQADFMIDQAIQQRNGTDQATVKAYTQLYREGRDLGRITVFADEAGACFWLADGFHRCAAATQAGVTTLPAVVYPGGRREALLYATSCNLHGKARSNADKKKSVLTLLQDAEWGRWSDNLIAKHTGVSQPFVSRLRKSLKTAISEQGESERQPSPTRQYLTKHGTAATMDITAIGKRPATDPSTDAGTPRGSHPPSGTYEPVGIEADTSSRGAGATALQWHDGDSATPALAAAPCQATDRQVPFPVSEDLVHAGLKEAEAVHATFPTRLCQLLEPLQELATSPDLEQLLLDISPDCYDRVDHYLDTAFETLSRLKTLWKAHRDADACHLQGQQEQPSLVLAVSAAPPQPSQPAQAPRRGETGAAQPRAETEDATKQTAQTGADYDTTRFYLGKPCRHGHTYGDTGQMLRRKSKGDCLQCYQESKRSRPQVKRQT